MITYNLIQWRHGILFTWKRYISLNLILLNHQGMWRNSRLCRWIRRMSALVHSQCILKWTIPDKKQGYARFSLDIQWVDFELKVEGMHYPYIQLGGTALVGCSLIFLISARDIVAFKKTLSTENRTSHAKINKSLILSLSVSDLLVAVSWK